MDTVRPDIDPTFGVHEVSIVGGGGEMHKHVSSGSSRGLIGGPEQFCSGASDGGGLVDGVRSLDRGLEEEKNPVRRSSRIAKIPRSGQWVEVLWVVGDDSREGELSEDEWAPNRDKVKRKVSRESRISGRNLEDENNSISVWWSALVGLDMGSRQLTLQYTNSHMSCSSLDLDDFKYVVNFCGDSIVRHVSPERHYGMEAEWRFSSWDMPSAEDNLLSGAGDDTVRKVVVGDAHLECRAMIIELRSTVDKLERRITSMSTIYSGLQVLIPDASRDLAKELSVDRVKRIMRALVVRCMGSAQSRGKRRKTADMKPLSRLQGVKQSFALTGWSDCFLSEFLELLRQSSSKLGSHINVQPATFQTSFMNLRTGARVRIVFDSFRAMCDALEIDEKTHEEMICEVDRKEYLSATGMRAVRISTISIVGFHIEIERDGNIQDTVVMGLSSKVFRSPVGVPVDVLHRPPGKWIQREGNYDTLYSRKEMEGADIQLLYQQCYGRDNTERGIAGNASAGKSTRGGGSFLVSDYDDFDIVLEWRRKSSQIQSAYAETSSTADVLGEVHCSIPRVQFQLPDLCHQVWEALCQKPLHGCSLNVN